MLFLCDCLPVMVGSAVPCAVARAVARAVAMRAQPVSLGCADCSMDIQTKTKTEYKGNTRIACIVLFVLG